jgi:hypothetical protein
MSKINVKGVGMGFLSLAARSPSIGGVSLSRGIEWKNIFYTDSFATRQRLTEAITVYWI